VETEFVSELASKLARAVPGAGEDLGVLRADLERTFRGLLAGGFERMDLVTREEFDVQRRVLERSREKLARLEAQVAVLEQQQSVSDNHSDNSGD
jgi:BMFP domain-containing protein YqiC